MRLNPVCKHPLSQRGGLTRRHYAGVLSRAALSPRPATRCSREARICSATVPWSTVVLCVCSLHGSSCFEEWDPQCRWSLSWNVRSFHMDQKRVLGMSSDCTSSEIAWNWFRIQSLTFGLRVVLQLSKAGCWFPLSWFTFIHTVQKKEKVLLLRTFATIKNIKG